MGEWAGQQAELSGRGCGSVTVLTQHAQGAALGSNTAERKEEPSGSVTVPHDTFLAHVVPPR